VSCFRRGHNSGRELARYAIVSIRAVARESLRSSSKLRNLLGSTRRRRWRIEVAGIVHREFEFIWIED
jgi:hypothetical protein